MLIGENADLRAKLEAAEELHKQEALCSGILRAKLWESENDRDNLQAQLQAAEERLARVDEAIPGMLALADEVQKVEVANRDLQAQVGVLRTGYCDSYNKKSCKQQNDILQAQVIEYKDIAIEQSRKVTDLQAVNAVLVDKALACVKKVKNGLGAGGVSTGMYVEVELGGAICDAIADELTETLDTPAEAGERVYTIDQIKAYANHWLAPALCTDMKDNVPANERLQAFMHYIDAEDSDNIVNFLKKGKNNVRSSDCNKSQKTQG
jgi:hypothetical protein